MFHNRISLVDILLEEVVMYLRKSRSDDPTLTVQEVLRNHEKELDDWCERNLGGTVDEKRKYKEIVSGEKMAERPELQKILKELERPDIKYLITNEPQRLSRGYLDEIGKLVLLLRHNHITVITPTKIYNMEDEYDRELFERELKRGNEYLEYFKKIQKRGKDRKVADGEYIGNIVPYGYKKKQYKEGKRTIKTLEVVPEEAEIIRMMFRWYVDEGLSMYGVAKRLNELKIPSHSGKPWSPNSAIKEILRNPVYIGKIRWQNQINVTTVENQELVTRKLRVKNNDYLLFDGLHEPIIDDETFQKAQVERKQKVPKKIKSNFVNHYAGIVFCAKCGRSMKLVKDRGTVRLMCSNIFDCDNATVRVDEVDDIICKTLIECIEDFEIKMSYSNDDKIEEHAKKIHLLEKNFKKAEETELAQWRAQTNADESQRMPAHIFKQLNEAVLKEKEDIKEALEKLRAEAPQKLSYEEKIYTFRKAVELIKDESVDVKAKNDFLKGIFEKITFERERAVRVNRAQAEQLGIPYNRVGWQLHPVHLDVKFKD